MVAQAPEDSFEITVVEEGCGDPEAKRLMAIKTLTELSQTVLVNRHAIGIVRARDAGEDRKAAEIISEANSAKIKLNDLKAAFRRLKKK